MITTFGTLLLGHRGDGRRVLIAGYGIGLGDVADVENRMRGQKVQALEDAELLGVELRQQRAHRLAFVQQA